MYEQLLLKNQICFPLYAASRDVIRKYTPYLKEIGLTYTQYITMLVMWEVETINVRELRNLLHLDTGTLSPLLKKLEKQELITRTRSSEDERNLDITITKKGKELKEAAKDIPSKIAKCSKLDVEESMELYRLLNKMLK